jgi:hypothetical protein
MEIMVLRSAMGFDSRAMQWKVKSTAGAGEKRLDPTVIQKNLGTGMYVGDFLQVIFPPLINKSS